MHDLRCSTRELARLVIMALILAVFTCCFCQRDILRMNINAMERLKGSAADFLFRWTEGMPVIVKENSREMFKVPAVWLLFHWWLSFTAGTYVMRDLKEQGANLLLRIHRRRIWWRGKCIWVILATLLYYLAVWLCMLLFSVFQGGCSLSITPGLHGLDESLAERLSGMYFTIPGILVPFAVSVGLALSQLAVTVYVNQIAGNLYMVILLVTSAYKCSPFLPGNYLMLLRNRHVTEEGVTAVAGLIMAAGLAFLSVRIGGKRFEKYDIF